MKHVTFSQPVPPYGVGDKRVVPDAVAERLQGDGLLSASEPWPAPAPVAQKPKRPVLRPARVASQLDLRLAGE